MNRIYKSAALVPILIAVLVAGCGGGSSPDTMADPPPVGLLKKVSGPAELEHSLKAGLTTIRGPQHTALGVDQTGAEAQVGAGGGNFTGTYTQELDVDELDAVRYDGEYLYVAPRRYLPCCYLAAGAPGDNASNTGSAAEASIRILAADPQAGTAALAGSIPLEDEVSVQGMYLDDGRMFALTSTLIYGSYGDFWTGIAVWAPEQLGFRVYDVSDPVSPEMLADVRIDGVFVDSRRVGDVVYVVSRYTPNIDGLVYHVTNAAEQAQNQARLAEVTLDDLLPKAVVNGHSRNLVDPARCYIGTDVDSGYPVITSVTAIPMNDPAAMTTTCYNEDAYGIYVAGESLYFTQFVADEVLGDTRTRIHKFGIAGVSLAYRGSTEIDGQVWRGGQLDFRMSEHEGRLRVLASSYDFGTGDFIDHHLYVIEESGSAPALEVVGELPNAQRPEEIGKPNEGLFGVRFVADRVYAVTFEQIDPLYVIDLSNPLDPRIAGELHVTGFSDFLHPVSDDLLLGLGTPAGGGVKLELFDVSDIDAPLSRGNILVAGPGSYSEASYDRHAFTYQADVGEIDRFTVPVHAFSETHEGGAWLVGLHLFEIHGKAAAMASLHAVGSIAPPAGNGAFPFDDRNRAFIHGDTVYYVRGERAYGANWYTPTIVNGPF